MDSHQISLLGDCLAEPDLLDRLALLREWLAQPGRRGSLNLAPLKAYDPNLPVLVLAGATGDYFQPQVGRYEKLLRSGLEGFQGLLISGGTRAGVSGMAGRLGSSRLGTVGYLPQGKPGFEAYGQLVRAGGQKFSLAQPLQMWADLLASGMEPERVCFLAISGGQITEQEIKLALALGARVGIFPQSGGACAAISQDRQWSESANLAILEPSPEAIREFVMGAVGGGRPIPFRLLVGAIGGRQGVSGAELESLHALVGEAVARAKASLLSGLGKEAGDLVIPNPLSCGRLGFEKQVADCVRGLHPQSQQHLVLPMLQSECFEELEDEAGQKSFSQWLDSAAAVQSIRAQPLASLFPPRMLPKARREAWLEAGKYLVDNCDFLLVQAVDKDDPDSDLLAALLQYAREKKCPCCQLPANQGGQGPEWSREADWVFSRELLQRVRRYNQRLAKTDLAEEAERKYFTAWLGELPSSLLGPERRQWLKNGLIAHYCFADKLSRLFQARFQTAGKWVLSSALLAAGVVGLGISFFGSAPWVFLLESLLLLAILGAIIWAEHTRARVRWTEYRYLAERLRTSYYLAVVRLPLYPEYFPRKRGGVVHASEGVEERLRGWSTLVFNELITAAPPCDQVEEAQAGELASFVKKHWIKDQYDFHAPKAKRTIGLDERYHSWGEVAFYGALFVALLHGLPWLLDLCGLPRPLHWLHHWDAFNRALTLLALVLPAVGATIGAIRNFMEYKRLARQSTGMRDRLAEMRDFDLAHLSRGEQLVTARSLEVKVRELERLMLSDVADWRQLIATVDLHKSV